MSPSVKQCMTVDIFPHTMANVVDIQNEHLYLHASVLNKTSWLSSVRIFVRLYRLLLIHCIYVSVTKPTIPTFRACLNSAWFHQILEGDRKKAIMLCSMALPSKLCAALHGQSNVCSMCDCNPCRSLDLSVWVEILSGVVSYQGTGPRRNCSVNSRSILWPI